MNAVEYLKHKERERTKKTHMMQFACLLMCLGVVLTIIVMGSC